MKALFNVARSRGMRLILDRGRNLLRRPSTQPACAGCDGLRPRLSYTRVYLQRSPLAQVVTPSLRLPVQASSPFNVARMRGTTKCLRPSGALVLILQRSPHAGCDRNSPTIPNSTQVLQRSPLARDETCRARDFRRRKELFNVARVRGIRQQVDSAVFSCFAPSTWPACGYLSSHRLSSR